MVLLSGYILIKRKEPQIIFCGSVGRYRGSSAVWSRSVMAPWKMGVE